MYLSPTSPLVHDLQFPEGFDIATTPLVTFRRSDMLFTKAELTHIHNALHPERAAAVENFELFGGDLVIDVPAVEYLRLFTAPLPEANYGTLVVSTGGHWTPWTLYGLHNDPAPHSDEASVFGLFEESMMAWSGLVQSWLRRARLHDDAEYGGGAMTMGGRRRQAVVRAYLPGHDNCHSFHRPWAVYEQANMTLTWNWEWIGPLNRIFEVKKHVYFVALCTRPFVRF